MKLGDFENRLTLQEIPLLFLEKENFFPLGRKVNLFFGTPSIPIDIPNTLGWDSVLDKGET